MSRVTVKHLIFSEHVQRWIPARSRRTLSSLTVERLSIIHYNVWFEPYAQAARTQALTALLDTADADVVCLQEVTPYVEVRLLACDWVREECEVVSCIDDSAKYGSLFLSRLPIARASWLPLDSIMGRVCMSLELHGAGGLKILSTHLESTREMAPTRAMQLGQIHDWIAEEPEVILLADMNFDPSEPEERIMPPGFRDTWLLLRGGATGHTQDATANSMLGRVSPGKHTRYDRIYYCGATWIPSRVERLGVQAVSATEGADRHSNEIFISDHFGLSVELAKCADSVPAA